MMQVPRVSRRGPADASKKAQHVKYEVVSGLIGGPPGMYSSCAASMTSASFAVAGKAVSCSASTETWFCT